MCKHCRHVDKICQSAEVLHMKKLFDFIEYIPLLDSIPVLQDDSKESIYKKDITNIPNYEYFKTREDLCYHATYTLMVKFHEFEDILFHQESYIWNEKLCRWNMAKMSKEERIFILTKSSIASRQNLAKSMSRGLSVIYEIFNEYNPESYESDVEIPLGGEFFSNLGQVAELFKRHDIAYKAFKASLKSFQHVRENYWEYLQKTLGNLLRLGNFKKAKKIADTRLKEIKEVFLGKNENVPLTELKNDYWTSFVHDFDPKKPDISRVRMGRLLTAMYFCHWCGMIAFYYKDEIMTKKWMKRTKEISTYFLQHKLDNGNPEVYK